MEINPYQAPLESDDPRAEAGESGSKRRSRPLGIWLLSGLHLVAGLFFLLALFLFLSAADRVDIPMPFALLISLTAFVAALALSSAVGMWLGERWGWWFAAFYYLWAVFGVIFNWGLSLATGATDGFEVHVEESIVLAVHALILAYLLRQKIRGYFRLETMPLHWALAAPVCMAIAALVVNYLAEF